MSDRFLSAKIYQDSFTPEISTSCAIDGLEIVKEIAPWIRVERDTRVLNLRAPDRDFIVVDNVSWPKLEADLNIILTKRSFANDDDLRSDGSLNLRNMAAKEEEIGYAFHMSRVNSKRVAIVNTGAIRRSEHIVAHEVGHLVGVQNKSPNAHCPDQKCLMFPIQFVHGKADRKFCECCSEQLHDNSLKLRRAKAGRLAIARNAKVF